MENIAKIPAKLIETMENFTVTFSESKSQQSPYQPQHVHFAGSIPLSSNTEVFKLLSKTFPGSLLRIPDGETGKRWNFVAWQHGAFATTPHIIRQLGPEGTIPDVLETPYTVISVGPIGYNDMAIESYTEFYKPRKEGIIKKGC